VALRSPAAAASHTAPVVHGGMDGGMKKNKKNKKK
jgi:hypothetical protein